MARNDYHAHLKSVPMFADLGRHELDVIAHASTELDLKAGHVLMSAGGSAHEMFIVIEGELEVTAEGEHIAKIGPGGFAGEMALLTRSHRHATVTALTKVHVLHIDGRAFATILEEAPQIAVKMLPIVASRVNELSDHHAH